MNLTAGVDEDDAGVALGAALIDVGGATGEVVPVLAGVAASVDFAGSGAAPMGSRPPWGKGDRFLRMRLANSLR